MKVLMFGWEFPPNASGGLGTACAGLTKGLSNHNIQVKLILPKAPKKRVVSKIKIESTEKFTKLIPVPSPLNPYQTEATYTHEYRPITKTRNLYGTNLFAEVERYSVAANHIIKQDPDNLDFDIIHCHDWMTFKAGIITKEATNKPLIIHVHSTEFDRSGFNNINQQVFQTELKGMKKADHIICVSYYTKRMIVERYNIPEGKISVIHNAVEFPKTKKETFKIKKKDKIVLFLGRVTVQKGPDYFIKAAKKVLTTENNVKFVVAGSGDMLPWLIEEAANLDIADHVLFAGFLGSSDVDRAFRMADVYVMPSVSEPFGITPLEAMRNNTPVIISKQSGVSEVINHCLKVDFWDIDKLAEKIIAVLRYKTLRKHLSDSADLEIRKFNWNEPAKKCIKVYNMFAS